MRRIAVLDAPSNLGLRPPTATSVPGCAKAPGALRDHGLLTRLHARDAGCLTPPRYDPGDWRPGDGVAHAAQIAAYSRKLADRIGGILDAGEFPVILGGDCSILLGSGLAMHRLGEAVGGRIGLVFVDGHSDFRHPGNASYVGAAAGEDLALVTGRGQADLASIEGRRPYFRDIDVVVLGIRAQDEYRLDLQAAGIVTRPVPALRAEGAARTAQWARDQLVDCAGYWVHVDVDVLDPAVMPAVDAPSPGGIAFPELELLLAGLVESPHCLGVEITVFDPDYDPDGEYAAEITTAVTAGLAVAHHVEPRPDLIAARADLARPSSPTPEPAAPVADVAAAPAVAADVAAAPVAAAPAVAADVAVGEPELKSDEPETPAFEEPATADIEGPESTVPERPESTVPERPESTAPEGPESTAPEGPESTAPEGPESTVPEGPESAVVEGPESATAAGFASADSEGPEAASFDEHGSVVIIDEALAEPEPERSAEAGGLAVSMSVDPTNAEISGFGSGIGERGEAVEDFAGSAEADEPEPFLADSEMTDLSDGNGGDAERGDAGGVDGGESGESGEGGEGGAPESEATTAVPEDGAAPEATDPEAEKPERVEEPVRLATRPLGQNPLLDSDPLPATRPGMLRPRPAEDLPAADGFSLPAQRPAFDLGTGSPADIA